MRSDQSDCRPPSKSMDQLSFSAPAVRQANEKTVWFVDGFDARDVLPVRFWRHAKATQYVVGLVATLSPGALKPATYGRY